MAELPIAQPHSPFFRYVGLPVARVVAFTLMLILGPFRRFGANRVPKSGGVLVLANHLSDIDVVIVQLACKRPIHFMAKSELFYMKGVGSIIRAFRGFPVKRGQPDRASLKHAITLLKMGEVVCVFPEGELSKNVELLELKKGITLIARQAEVPCICVGLKNTNRVIPYGSLIPRPSWSIVSARWGSARQFCRTSEVDEILSWTEAQLRELTA